MQETKKYVNFIAAAVFTCAVFAALLIVRFALFYYESFDYIHSLSVWVSKYRTMSFWEGLGTKVGNYNQPYMYLLNILTRTGIPELYFIKILSVIFDVVLAYFVMKLVSLKTFAAKEVGLHFEDQPNNMKILAFLLAFAVPTVILNSAMWGQCDAIFVSFALGSVYFALSRRGSLARRSRLSYVFIALAVSFKLQAAFILPLFAVFVMQKKIRLKDCWIFFLVFFWLLIPALIAGFPARDLLLMYFDQSGTYLYLNLNAVNIWQFVSNVEFAPLRTAGLFMGGSAILGLMYFAFVHREKLSANADYIRLAFLFAVLVPFLLPQMHDRFFYMADIFALVLFLYDKRRWFVPLVCVFCSFITYAWLIMDYIYVFDYKTAALMLAAVIFIVLRDLVISLRKADLSPLG